MGWYINQMKRYPIQEKYLHIGKNHTQRGGFISRWCKSGLWKYWYSEGQLSSKGIFRNNLKTGVWLEFYDNGNKKMQTIYRNGLKMVNR